MNFIIINEDKDDLVNKTSIDIRLNGRITIEQLKAIGLKLKNDRPSMQKLWAFYYLPENEIGNGAWAITHFKPKLEVKILGSTKESFQELNSKLVSGNILGIWLDNDALAPNKLFLVREHNKLIMKTIYAKSSITNGGEILEDLLKTKKNGLTKYNYENNHGEYYIIEKNGNLGLYDKNGKFKEAKKVKQ
nr:hypothetical protein [uncultured Psychroserpens sp.]